MRVIEGKQRQLGGGGGGGEGGGGEPFKDPCSKQARKWFGGRPAADTHSGSLYLANYYRCVDLAEFVKIKITLNIYRVYIIHITL